MESGRWRAEPGAEERWKTKDTVREQDAEGQKALAVPRGCREGSAVDGKKGQGGGGGRGRLSLVLLLRAPPRLPLTWCLLPAQ